MKTLVTVLLITMCAFTLACGGYSSSSHTITPPTAGTTPTISALAPANVPAGSTGVVLTVNGTNFNSTASINWQGAALPKTTFVSTNQLMGTIPDADVATAGTASVTVSNPGVSGGIYGGGTTAETSNSMTFTIN